MKLLKRLAHSVALRVAVLAAAIAVSSACAAALDLPVKTINGTRYYCYTVHRLDNVLGVADLLGISRAQIVKYNPWAADGLKQGQVLTFPVSDFGEPAPSAATEPETTSGSGTSTEVPGTIRYVVQKDETLFGVAKKFGVEPEDIIAYNPLAETGVRNGQVLLIPRKTDSEPEAEKPAQSVQNAVQKTVPEAALAAEPTPTATPAPEANDDNNNADADKEDVNAEEANTPHVEVMCSPEEADTAAVEREFTVVLMQPFMLGDEKASRAANLITDFYKGFLVAADTLVGSASAPHAAVIAIDTRNNTAAVAEILANDRRIAEADVIIAPDNNEQLKLIADYGREHHIPVLNVGGARSNEYLTNSSVMQALIPSQMMLDKAADAFVDGLDGYTPVFLRNTNGHEDKLGFVNDIVARLAAKGINGIDVEYSGGLSYSELVEQLGDPTTGLRYIFLPTSGTLSEFNKFSGAVEKYRKELLLAEGDSRLFGYPEWSAFRGDPLKSLYSLKTTIYTRSFSTPDSPETRGVNNSFVKWFGRPMVDGVPTQGLMGYDTGMYVLGALAAGALGDNDGRHYDYRGVQSSFSFRHITDADGAVNQALYIVDFLPGETIDIQIK